MSEQPEANPAGGVVPRRGERYTLRMRRLGGTIVGLAVLAAGGWLSWLLVGTDLRVEAYRGRLQSVSDELRALRTRYDAVVRQTAVTELAVEDGRVRVSIRGIDGSIESIETPFDPSREIYVDYVVIDGRLWIRRVFDDATPPSQAVSVDPALVDVDWSDAGARYGKAAYRPLADGHWVVSVTGDGSLGLRRRGDDEDVTLSAAPGVREYPPLEQELREATSALTPGEFLRALARLVSPAPSRTAR